MWAVSSHGLHTSIRNVGASGVHVLQRCGPRYLHMKIYAIHFYITLAHSKITIKRNGPERRREDRAWLPAAPPLRRWCPPPPTTILTPSSDSTLPRQFGASPCSWCGIPTCHYPRHQLCIHIHTNWQNSRPTLLKDDSTPLGIASSQTRTSRRQKLQWSNDRREVQPPCVKPSPDFSFRISVR